MPDRRGVAFRELRLIGVGALAAFAVVGLSGAHGWWEIGLVTPLSCWFLTEFLFWLPSAAKRKPLKRQESTDA